MSERKGERKGKRERERTKKDGDKESLVREKERGGNKKNKKRTTTTFSSWEKISCDLTFQPLGPCMAHNN